MRQHDPNVLNGIVATVEPQQQGLGCDLVGIPQCSGQQGRRVFLAVLLAFSKFKADTVAFLA
ncbi:hypothetical protein, partial [Thiolapillus sp.]|uniref:hypothetical protein n=1 Tax=Thiolapillus sp. TaxID=2017437 RepID=UPI003AF7795A